MRKIQEILRLKEAGLSNRQIAKSVNSSPSTVSVLLSQAEKAGISWPLPDDMDEETLTAKLYPVVEKPKGRHLPDMEWIHRELKRKSVTLQLLWEEYKNQHPDGYRYSYFCELYYEWRQKLDPPLRQTYRAGEKMLVDFAGQTVPILDPKTKETLKASIFIAVLGASNYTFAHAVLAQDLENWILLHCLSFEYFGGVPEIIVPDNPRTAVKSTCRYEPDLNPTYHEMAQHYGCVVIPARPYKPRDYLQNHIIFKISRSTFNCKEFRRILKIINQLNPQYSSRYCSLPFQFFCLAMDFDPYTAIAADDTVQPQVKQFLHSRAPMAS